MICEGKGKDPDAHRSESERDFIRSRQQNRSHKQVQGQYTINPIGGGNPKAE